MKINFFNNWSMRRNWHNLFDLSHGEMFPFKGKYFRLGIFGLFISIQYGNQFINKLKCKSPQK